MLFFVQLETQIYIEKKDPCISLQELFGIVACTIQIQMPTFMLFWSGLSCMNEYFKATINAFAHSFIEFIKTVLLGFTFCFKQKYPFNVALLDRSRNLNIAKENHFKSISKS